MFNGAFCWPLEKEEPRSHLSSFIYQDVRELQAAQKGRRALCLGSPVVRCVVSAAQDSCRAACGDKNALAGHDRRLRQFKRPVGHIIVAEIIQHVLQPISTNSLIPGASFLGAHKWLAIIFA